LAAFGAIVAVFLAGNARAQTEDAVATIYSGGEIVTMEGDQPEYVEALVVRDGVIAYLGSRPGAQNRFPEAETFDLEGHTLLPGFVDGHGHIFQSGFLSLMANLYPDPDGPGVSFDSVVKSLQEWSSSADGSLVIGKLGWIIGNGYDDSRLAETEHPTAQVLDQVSTDRPVMIIHQSGHLASVNSKALELLGVTKETPDPPGGAIRRNPDGTPNGVLEEAAFFRAAFSAFGRPDAELNEASIARGQQQYAHWGYTTAQDGRSSNDNVAALNGAAEAGHLYIDIVAYPDIEFARTSVETGLAHGRANYAGHFRIGGAKLSLDGSPQGKTAWLTQPYLVPPQGKPADYAGYPAMSNERAAELVELAFRNRWQLLVHANGDAAIDQLIWAVGRALETNSYPDHRTVLIHGQTLRLNQIPWLKAYGILPSLFPMHTFYWGDWHKSSVLGNPRADFISPTRAVLDAGLTLTSHHDAPVTFPNSMRVLDATVNRVTRSGEILGPDQRLTPYEGLKALTIWAALQHFEENHKGSLKTGKLADLVVLDANPMNIDPRQIHSIQVLRTIKAGHTVWEAPNNLTVLRANHDNFGID